MARHYHLITPYLIIDCYETPLLYFCEICLFRGTYKNMIGLLGILIHFATTGQPIVLKTFVNANTV